MVKKSTPAEKAARMLDLVPYISTHQGISRTELAADFGITDAELLSDLNALWMCGDNRFDLIDLEFESGYVTIRNAETLNLVRSLTTQEIISILIGLDLIRKDLPQDRDDLFQAITSLQRKLGKGLEHTIEALPSLDSQILSKVQEALSQSKKLKIDYYTASEDRISTRMITPLNLIHSEGNDFLIAFCDSSQSQRTFRVDRIRHLELSEERAAQIELHNLPPATSRSKVSISRDFRKCCESLGVDAPPSGSEISLSTFSPQWLLRTVISTGGAMTVLEPLEVRSEVSSRAKAALELYR
jgi:predicted DNA-binding transcriptional regulator YafY